VWPIDERTGKSAHAVFILLIGALLFTFYQFKQQPIFFNNAQQEKLLVGNKKDSAILLQTQFAIVNTEETEGASAFQVDETKAKKDLKHSINKVMHCGTVTKA